MSQPTNISDDPLPPADPVTPAADQVAHAPHTHEGENKLHLEDPHFGGPAGSYGHTDPASLAAVQSQELAAPSLDLAEHAELDAPELTLFVPGGGLVAASPPPEQETVSEIATQSVDFSSWDPHLAHLAQVGLTPADHWDEQIKPRIDQLHEDITQVNVQLDDLEQAKPKRKPKKS